jgi:hypothetical protein
MDPLVVEAFEPLLDEVFAVRVGDSTLELRLSEVAAKSHHSPVRQAFSLLFTGPSTPVLSQGTYELQHAAVGEVALFLVPIGADADGARYEAIFT